jgi:exopolysaccharide biosynthesis WecB/TagA/CpsF family protein
MKFMVGGGSVRVNVPSRDALLRDVKQRLADNDGFAIATLNLDHLVKLGSDPNFLAAYARQDFVTADGNPIVWLARVAGSPIELVPGSDIVRPLLGIAADLGVPVAFLGSTQASLDAAAVIMSNGLPGLEVRARLAPPMGFDPESLEALEILDDLASQGVRLVFLALGAPKQERLAAVGRARHPHIGFVSVGAGLDFIAGRQRRAPRWVRRLALEWLWRLASDPQRLAWRYLKCATILPRHLSQALVRRNV